MNHEEALRLMAPERYLTDDLSPESREQFEEHFFGCQECALDVRAGALFLEHAKDILASPTEQLQAVPVLQRPVRPPAPFWGWLRPAIWVPAMAVLLVVLGYQNLVMYPKLRQAVATISVPQILPAVSLIGANTRGADRPVANVQQGKPFLLYIDIPPDKRFSSYVAELRGPAQETAWSLTIPSDATKEAVPIRVPAGLRAAGEYTLVVRGGTGTDTVELRYPFELQLQP